MKRPSVSARNRKKKRGQSTPPLKGVDLVNYNLRIFRQMFAFRTVYMQEIGLVYRDESEAIQAFWNDMADIYQIKLQRPGKPKSWVYQLWNIFQNWQLLLDRAGGEITTLSQAKELYKQLKDEGVIHSDSPGEQLTVFDVIKDLRQVLISADKAGLPLNLTYDLRRKYELPTPIVVNGRATKFYSSSSVSGAV